LQERAKLYKVDGSGNLIIPEENMQSLLKIDKALAELTKKKENYDRIVRESQSFKDYQTSLPTKK
jgi:hypothetical protein